MKSKTFWIVAAAIIVLAGISTGLIIYGVTTHRERGPLELCWIDGEAFYSRSDCTKQSMIWPREQIPLKTGFSSDHGAIEPTKDDARVLNQLIRDLNQELGFPLFVLDDAKTVAVRMVPIEVGEGGGRTSHVKYGNRISAFVTAQSGMHDSLLYRVLRHELLHAAGLAHDEYPLSVMYPLTRDDTGVEPQVRQIISDADRAFLRDQYMTR